MLIFVEKFANMTKWSTAQCMVGIAIAQKKNNNQTEKANGFLAVCFFPFWRSDLLTNYFESTWKFYSNFGERMSFCFCNYSELCRTNYRKKTAILVIKLGGCFVFKFENYSNFMEVFFLTIEETRWHYITPNIWIC